jgi:hypothetical protein
MWTFTVNLNMVRDYVMQCNLTYIFVGSRELQWNMNFARNLDACWSGSYNRRPCFQIVRSWLLITTVALPFCLTWSRPLALSAWKDYSLAHMLVSVSRAVSCCYLRVNQSSLDTTDRHSVMNCAREKLAAAHSDIWRSNEELTTAPNPHAWIVSYVTRRRGQRSWNCDDSKKLKLIGCIIHADEFQLLILLSLHGAFQISSRAIWLVGWWMLRELRYMP